MSAGWSRLVVQREQFHDLISEGTASAGSFDLSRHRMWKDDHGKYHFVQNESLENLYIDQKKIKVGEKATVKIGDIIIVEDTVFRAVMR